MTDEAHEYVSIPKEILEGMVNRTLADYMNCPPIHLRDHFAGLAMQGNMPDTEFGREIVAEYAYKMADAMLAEREKEND